MRISLALWLIPVALNATTIYDAVPVDYPGSDGTFLDALNDSGTAVGFTFVGNVGLGLIYSGGALTALSYPDANNTSFWGINDSGVLVGSANSRALVFNGTNFSLLNVPGAVVSNATGINNAGVIAGNYTDSSSVKHFFVDNGGVFITFDAPFGYTPAGLHISDDGMIVGSYNDANSNPYSFTYQDGTFLPLLCPGSTFENVGGINLHTDTIVGSCFNLGTPLTPFIYSGGEYSFPGFTGLPGVPGAPWGITDDGSAIAGTYASNGFHGFFATQVTPEPGAFLLLGGGLLALGLIRLRAGA